MCMKPLQSEEGKYENYVTVKTLIAKYAILPLHMLYCHYVNVRLINSSDKFMYTCQRRNRRCVTYVAAAALV